MQGGVEKIVSAPKKGAHNTLVTPVCGFSLEGKIWRIYSTLLNIELSEPWKTTEAIWLSFSPNEVGWVISSLVKGQLSIKVIVHTPKCKCRNSVSWQRHFTHWKHTVRLDLLGRFAHFKTYYGTWYCNTLLALAQKKALKSYAYLWVNLR